MRQILIVLAIFVAVAQAQDATHAIKGSILDHVALPGELSITSGDLSSYERGNVVADTEAEQRAVVYSTLNGGLTVTPYIATDVVLDTYGYNWNNRFSPSLGIKVNRKLPKGVISAGIGYMRENRFRNADGFKSASGLTDFVTTWFGWKEAYEPANRFPGSAWVIAGHFSPVEAGNLMERGHIQQGFVVARFNTKALIPYAEATFAHDSQRLDWENIAMVGTGVKMGFPTGHAIYTEVGAGYLREMRLISNRTATGFKVFVNVSYSWSLFGRKLP